MTQRHWAEIDAHSDAQLEEMGYMLEGAAFRTRSGADVLGTVALEAGKLALVHNNGRLEKLNAWTVKSYSFDINPDNVRVEHGGKKGSSVGSTSERSKEELFAIAQACPPWAQRSVLKALLPDECAAWEQQQKNARVAQLKATTRAATGKAAGNAVSSAQAARVEQLREIGRKVSAQR